MAAITSDIASWPQELLVHIASFLRPQDLAPLGESCRAFRTAVNNAIVFKRVLGIELSEKAVAEDYKKSFLNTQIINKRLKEKKVTREELYKLCEEHPNYYALTFNALNSAILDSEAVKKILQGTVCLKSFTLEGAGSLTPGQLTSSLGEMRKLKTLKLTGPILVDQAVQAALKSNRKLEVLCLQGEAAHIKGRPLFTVAALASIASEGKNLKELELTIPNTQITYAALKKMGELFKRLSKLTLLSKTHLTVAVIEEIVKNSLPGASITLGPCSQSVKAAIEAKYSERQGPLVLIK